MNMKPQSSACTNVHILTRHNSFNRCIHKHKEAIWLCNKVSNRRKASLLSKHWDVKLISKRSNHMWFF